MYRNSPPQFHTQFPTLQSIDAHSQVSVDLRPNELQPLISKIFLLCIELERKDNIIDQLQTQAQFKNQMRKSQIDVSNKQFMIRYDRIEQENRILIESNVMLKNNVVTMERVIADLEVHKERSAYNKELQERVFSLELKLKRAEEQKIQYLEREKNLKRENSMLSYSAIKTSQKNRIRDLQYQLSQEKQKLEAQKRLNADLKYQVEKDITEIKSLRQSQHIIKRTYEQRIQKIQLVKANEDLKQSQCTAANEQKIALLSQQLNRLRQELQQQRSAYRQQKLKMQQKDGQIRRLLQDISSLQQKLKSKQKVFENMQGEISIKQQEQLKQIQSLSQTVKSYKQNQSQIQSFIKQKQIQQQERSRQIQRLRIQVEELEKNREELNAELRKVKRKNGSSINSECQICKIRSSTVIQSSKSIGSGPKSSLNLQQIIQETEKLNLSNKKVQSLINHHEISIQYSNQNTTINISQ